MLPLIAHAMTALSLVAAAQGEADNLRARWQPGLVLSYEFEGHFGMVPQRVSETAENISYRGPGSCDYYFSTLIEVRILEQTPERGFAGSVAYLQPELKQWQCPDIDHNKAEDRLRMTAAHPLAFSVNSRGEITFPPVVEEQLDFRGNFRLLSSSTVDLLHTILANRTVAPGDEWKPGENAVYWKDARDTGLEITASTVKYVRDLEVAGDRCALLKFRYIFAPEDTPASASTAQGTVRLEYAGTLTTGSLQIATLFDRTTGHIAWIHRSRAIDNQVYLGRQADGTTNTHARFHLVEESTVRELRKESSLAWSAGLKNFENAEGAPRPPQAGDSGPLTRAALETRARRRQGEGEAQEMAPPGYARFEKRLCSSTWSCSVVSVAMPGSVRVEDDTPERITFLATTGTATASINIGPNQQKIVRGLTDQEELRKNVLAFLANKLWLRTGPGTAGNVSETYVEDYPALLTDFTASRGDGLRMEGRLASVLTAWGEIITIGCGYTQPDARTQEEVCRQVLGSVRVRQVAPQ
jgi:hypothetical protein